MSTLTPAQQQSIADYIKDRTIPAGLGTEDQACSIAAINLALDGKLTDTIPTCMSEVIGRWVIVVQDAMPDEMRNSAEWRALLPLAAGTGLEREQQRLTILLEWMWTAVLPSLSSIAEQKGFGAEWSAMLRDKSPQAAIAAYAAARAAYVARAASAAYAASEASAADAASAAADAASEAASAAASAAARAAYAAYAAARAAYAAAARAAYAATNAAWGAFDPIGLLRQLIEA